MNFIRKVYVKRCYLTLVAVICAPGMLFASGLGSLLHQVEQTAPQLRVANARADATSAGVRVAKSQYWEHGELFGQSTHYNSDRLVNPISFPPVLSKRRYFRGAAGDSADGRPRGD